MANRPGAMDIDALLGSSRLGPMQLSVVGLCLLVMLIDGYDLFMIGLALPAIAADFGVDPADLTQIVVAQNLGLALGTFVAGPLSDRFGRKMPLVFSIVAFGGLTLLTTQAQDIVTFTVLRFLTGMFCAAVIPNAAALTTEMSPLRWRSGFVALIFCGYAGGTAISSFVNGQILQSHDWQVIFWIGGCIALAMVVPLLLWLPESLSFRVQRNPDDPGITVTAARMVSSPVPPGTRWRSKDEPPAKGAPGSSIAALFRDGRGVMTLLLWALFSLSFILNTSLAAWSATVFNVGAGLSIAATGVLIGVFSLSGVIGTGTSGFIMGRFGAGKTLFALYAASLLAMIGLAFSDYGGALVFVFAALAGFCFVGGQGALNAFVAAAYPTRLRATGVGWAFGTGRLGAIVGPVIGGMMIARGYGVTAFFLALSIPLAVILCLVPMVIRARDHSLSQQES